MSRIAYALREEFTGTVTQEVDGEERETPKFLGGLLAATDDVDLDVNALLEAGGGRIVIDPDAVDQRVVNTLEEYPPLKRVAVADDAPVAALDPDAEHRGYPAMTVTELRAQAASREIEGAKSATKDPLVVALEEHDRRLAEESLDDLEGGITIDNLVAAAAAREE